MKRLLCLLGWHCWTWKLERAEVIRLHSPPPDRAICSRCGARYGKEVPEDEESRTKRFLALKGITGTSADDPNLGSSKAMKRKKLNHLALCVVASSGKTQSGPISAMYAAGFSEAEIQAFIEARKRHLIASADKA